MAMIKQFSILFIPLPVETLGGWNIEAEKQIERIGRELGRWF